MLVVDFCLDAILFPTNDFNAQLSDLVYVNETLPSVHTNISTEGRANCFLMHCMSFTATIHDWKSIIGLLSL